MTRSPDEQGDTADAARAVTALYRAHALGLTRLAFLVLGDRPAAEDVVQDAFCGLYRAWDRLPDHDNVQGWMNTIVASEGGGPWLPASHPCEPPGSTTAG